jgi:hypothetical protein
MEIDLPTANSTGADPDRVRDFQKQHGDLESVRQRLGMTKREISELLWVEASAWTRWSKGISRPPDSIYRALSWYLELHPGRAASVTPRPAVRAPEAAVLPASDWSEERKGLLQELERKETLSFGWKLVLVICLFISIWNLLF